MAVSWQVVTADEQAGSLCSIKTQGLLPPPGEGGKRCASSVCLGLENRVLYV